MPIFAARPNPIQHLAGPPFPSRRRMEIKTHQIQGTPNQVVPHTGTILTPPSTDKNDAMLLDVVALPRNVRGNHTARREPHTRRLPLARIGLLRSRDAHLEADALLGRCLEVGECRGDGVARPLRFPAALCKEKMVVSYVSGLKRGLLWCSIPGGPGSGLRCAWER